METVNTTQRQHEIDALTLEASEIAAQLDAADDPSTLWVTVIVQGAKISGMVETCGQSMVSRALGDQCFRVCRELGDARAIEILRNALLEEYVHCA